MEEAQVLPRVRRGATRRRLTPLGQPVARTLDVHFDYRSPFAYVAAEILPEFGARHALAIRWRPTDIELLGNYAQGLPYSEIKRRYVALDAIRTAEYHGVTIRMPKPHPVLSGRALRLAVVAGDDARFEALHLALFRAAWRDQLDLSSDEVLRACIAQAGGPADRWLAAADGDDAGEQLAAVARDAEQAGVFGVPAMLLGGEQFWGVDSLPQLEWRLARTA